jgi:dipeptidyl aminopeptidase/acylaminoacyl peptidase
MALPKMPSVKAVVVGGGFSDLISLRNWRKAFDTALYSKLIPNYKQTKNEELLKVRSVYYFANQIPKTIPILLLHGTADGNVPATQSINLAQKFYELKQPFRLILYEGGFHSLEQFRTEYQAEIVKWFNKYLRDQKEPPNLEPVFNR